jgi:predicted MFS family arabinose efflux permease
MIGGFGELIAKELDWSRDVVYGGFALALMLMGIASPISGRLIDQFGGGPIMIAGAVLSACGCLGLALCQSLVSYYLCWVVLGIAMRFTLYDAAFAALARIGGPDARKAMSQITLVGGLASTLFWPIGDTLAQHFGWRGALLVYAGLALATIPLVYAIPNDRHDGTSVTDPVMQRNGPPLSRNDTILAAALYVLIATLTNFLNAGMSAQMIAILAGLGVGASTAVWIATLRGIGQSSARLAEIVFGQRLDPIRLNLIATAILPFSFIFGLFAGQLSFAAVAFAFLYGVGNGIVTITRGTMPLVLFDHRTYGTFVGELIAPSFIFSAVAPLVYAIIMDRLGYAATQYFSISIAFFSLGASVVLFIRFSPRLKTT